MRQFVPIALAAALLAGAADARELFVNTLEGYTIRQEVLAAPNCSGPAIEETGLIALQHLERGICIYHRPARSPDDTAEVLSLLNRAQLAGLPPVHQQLAGLLTGLAHCSEADRHLAAFRVSGNEDALARLAFCRSRRQAEAEFNAIRWDHALFEYADGLGAGRTIEARLGEMGACFVGALDPAFNPECGRITNISESEITAFVDEAAGEVITRYFSGVESPITAMFSRKLKRAEGLKEAASAGIADLAAKAAEVNAQFEALDAAYVDVRDEKMGPIYDAYRSAILRATAIVDEFERWQEGLFITAENVNLLPRIQERGIELAEEEQRARELQFADETARLLAEVRQIIEGEAATRRTTAALCRIYFCELVSRRSLAGVINACRRPSLSGNPLCIEQDGSLRDGNLTVEFDGPQRVAVPDVCQAAGVDPVFTVLNMQPATAASCLVGLE